MVHALCPLQLRGDCFSFHWLLLLLATVDITRDSARRTFLVENGARARASSKMDNTGNVEVAEISNRCRGLMIGLAAGDRNGGPIQMALMLAESLAKQQDYKPVDAFLGYNSWYNSGKGVDAWDTGPTSRQLLHLHNATKSIAFDDRYLEILEDRSRKLNQRLNGLTAGVNAAHRVAPLALGWFLNNDQLLIEAAQQESRLTHWSSISQDTCAVVAVLCRQLLLGVDFFDAIQNILQREDELTSETPIIMKKIQEGLDVSILEKNSNTTGGFCPEVLKAALHFVAHSECFEDALNQSIAFAGPSNYCPVLVGAIAGARYGASNVSDEVLVHCKPGVESRCHEVASQLSLGFHKNTLMRGKV
jgi:ADP-ribosylglycohydrolase